MPMIDQKYGMKFVSLEENEIIIRKMVEAVNRQSLALQKKLRK
jgi:hypothetical protein